MYYMGQANNRAPAPWELASNSMSPPSTYLAKGGKASKGHKGMTKVHMNRQETNILDHIQGGPEHGPEGVKVYSHLEELLRNPHIVRNVHHHAQKHRHHHAQGGIERFKHAGRFGDTEAAMIGPNTLHLFNQIVGHPTKNPHTGHPEYFDLSGALGGLWDTVSGVAGKVPGMVSNLFSSAAPVAQQAASAAGNALNSDQFKNFATGALNATQPLIQNALNKQFGDDWGGVAGAIGKTAQNQYLGQGDPNSMWHQAGQAAGSSINRYNQGYTPQQAAGYGMNQFGQGMGGNYGQALQGFGNAMQGQGTGGYRMPNRQDMYNSMNSPMARNAVQDIGTNLIQGGWGGGQQAARNQMNQYMQRGRPQPSNMNSPYNQGFDQQRYDPYDEYNYMNG